MNSDKRRFIAVLNAISAFLKTGCGCAIGIAVLSIICAPIIGVFLFSVLNPDPKISGLIVILSTLCGMIAAILLVGMTMGLMLLPTCIRDFWRCCGDSITNSVKVAEKAYQDKILLI